MKSRRRFLIDMFCIGGGLAAASQIQPLFAHFLEGQPVPPPVAELSPQPAEPPTRPVDASPNPQDYCTEAYPSDSGTDRLRHEPVLVSDPSGLKPLWERLD